MCRFCSYQFFDDGRVHSAAPLTSAGSTPSAAWSCWAFPMGFACPGCDSCARIPIVREHLFPAAQLAGVAAPAPAAQLPAAEDVGPGWS